MIKTVIGTKLEPEMVSNYFEVLVNQFFKILPMRENGEDSLPTYLESLRSELLGCEKIIVELDNDPLFISLVSILQYLIDSPEITVRETKREVFKAISVCNRIRARVSKEGADQ